MGLIGLLPATTVLRDTLFDLAATDSEALKCFAQCSLIQFAAPNKAFVDAWFDKEAKYTPGFHERWLAEVVATKLAA